MAHLSKTQRKAASSKASATQLLELARRYPDQVLANPALVLISLEDPEAWLEITTLARRVKLSQQQDALYLKANDRALRLFATDCAERLWSGYAREYPQDDQPRQALLVARNYARGQAPKGELIGARNAASWAVCSVSHPSFVAQTFCGLARSALADSCSTEDIKRLALDAELAAAFIARNQTSMSPKESQDASVLAFRDSERAWQVEQLSAYIRGVRRKTKRNRL